MNQTRVSTHARPATSSREQFISRTYNTLLGAILLFVLIETVLFRTGLAASITHALLGVSWLVVLGGFILVSWFASRAAHQAGSIQKQYLALVAFVAAESIIFVPLLYMAESIAPGTIEKAAWYTLAGFAALTFIAFNTRKNFSFLAGMLRWVGLLALAGIVLSVIGGMALGGWFSLLMIAYAGAAILYDTSSVIHEFREDQHVGAALQLFASVALMFWYMVRFIGFAGDD